MLHKLDLSQSDTSEVNREAVVDDEQLVANNHPLRDTASPAVNTRTPMRKKNSLLVTLVISLIAIAAGVGTGYGSHKLFATSSGGTNIPANMEQIATGTVTEGDVFGSTDKDTFKDSVKGYLQKGGLDGEGSHKLLREGGPSQTVYMTSSVTDLDKFDGMEVQVWGETFSGQKAGWLMDVGRVEILKVKGEAPADAEEE